MLNGLSQNSGYSITQDKRGFIWMGTQEGLNRFDGYSFTTIRQPLQVSISNQMDAVLTGTDGKLWAGTPDGLFLLDASSNQLQTFSKFFHQSPTLIDSVSILQLFEDAHRNTWILTRYHGLFVADSNGRLQQFFSASGQNDRLAGITADNKKRVWIADLNSLYLYEPGMKVPALSINLSSASPEKELRIRSICSAGEEIWIGTAEQGILIWNTTTAAFRKFAPALTGNSIHAITCMLRDRQQRMWIGTRNAGLYRYDPATSELIHCRYADDQPGALRKDFVLSLFEDKQGLIWIGLSGGGFAKYDPYNSIFHTLRKNYRNDRQLTDNMLFALFSNGDEHLYIGSQNGGVVKWNTKQNSFTSYKDPGPDGVIHNTVYGIASGGEDILWLATWGGLCKLRMKAAPQKAFRAFSTGKDASKTYLYSVFRPRGSKLLLVSGMNGIYQFDTEQEQWLNWIDKDSLLLYSKPVVRCFYEDAQQQIWMGTEGMGLLRYSPSENKIIPIGLSGLQTKNIRSLLDDGNGFLWIGTDNGLVQYQLSSKQVKKIWQTSDGLANNVVYGILRDHQHRLWLSTNNGLSCFDALQSRFFNYDMSYGLPGLEYNTSCCYSSIEGTMYFGGIDGLTWFHPSNVPADKFNPVPLITGFSLLNTTEQPENMLQNQSAISLQHTQNFFNIEFSSLNYSHTNRTVYAYRLTGVDDDWVNSGTRRSATYTKLAPGKYTFQVRSANSQGNWSSEPASLQITIMPAFWQTKWFMAAVLLLLIAFIWWLIKRRISNIRKQAALQHKISTTEMMALRAQMNPHFIFNCINSIDALIQSNDKYNATVYLNKFARLIRNILDSSNQHVVPLQKDLDTLRLYIELEQLRNEHKFTAEIDVPEELLQDDVKVPPLIIQPYVENAILHGLRNRPGNKGLLKISLSRNDDQLHYVIEDNGVGRNAAMTAIRRENVSYGMAMSRDRVKLFNKETDASVQITDLEKNDQPAGTRIEVQLKIQ